MVAKALEDDSNVDVAEKFYEALGSGKADGCRTWRVDQKTGEREFLGKRSITNDDFDLFIKILQDDYPRGGKYIFSLVDANNKVIGNSSIVLGPLPEAQQPRAERPAPAASSGIDPFLQLMLNQQERQAQAARETNNLIITGIIGVATAMAPNLFKKQEKGESAIELLNAVLDAQKKITPPDEADAFEKTLNRMAKMKTIMGETGGDSDGGGLIGLAKSFMPGLMQLASTQAAQPTPGLPAPVPQQPRPAVAAPAENPLEKYRPLMEGVKVLLASQEPPGVVATYIDMQMRVGALSRDDMTALLDHLNGSPHIFLPTLGMYGITSTFHALAVATALALINRVQDGDELQRRWAAYGIVPGQEHAALVATCLSYVTDDLDDDAEEVGMGGDSANPVTHGPNGGGGIDHAANSPPGPETNPATATA